MKTTVLKDYLDSGKLFAGAPFYDRIEDAHIGMLSPELAQPVTEAKGEDPEDYQPGLEFDRSPGNGDFRVFEVAVTDSALFGPTPEDTIALVVSDLLKTAASEIHEDRPSAKDGCTAETPQLRGEIIARVACCDLGDGVEGIILSLGATVCLPYSGVSASPA